MYLVLGPVSIGRRKKTTRRVPHNINTWQNLHWGTRTQWKKAWRRAVELALCEYKVDTGTKLNYLPLNKAHITVSIYQIRLMDEDNLRSSCKVLLDALRDLEVILDDSPEHIKLKVEQFKVAHRDEEHVEIFIK